MAATDEIDELLAVPLPAFVAERRRIADALKAAGRRADAAEIAKLAKPSVPVWVINQLARREGALVKRLGALTTELRLAPMDRQGLRGDAGQAGAVDYAQIVAAHRDVLKSLRAAAERVLVASGQGANLHTLERVLQNLRAGVVVDETRAAIEAGRFLHEVGQQDFASLMSPLDPVRAGTVAPAESPPAGSRAPGHDGGPRTKHGPAEAGAPDATPPPGKLTREQRTAARERGRAQAAHEKEQARAAVARERAQAREQLIAARERARARADAARAVERLRTRVAAAEKVAIQEERTRESARAALVESERRADAARRAVEALAHELEAAQAAARAIPSSS